MAIEEIDDFPEKMEEFELHWGSVNQSLGGTAETDFTLPGNFKLADFSSLKQQVEAALTSQEGLENDLDFVRSDRDALRADLRQKVILFRGIVQSDLQGSRYVRALPDTPSESADQQKHLEVLDDVAHIWDKINTDQPAEIAPELKLRGGYTRDDFVAELATMRERYSAVKAAERAARDARGLRDQLLDQAYGKMVKYRERLPLVLEPDDPLVASMPRITPPSSGGGSSSGGGNGTPALATARYDFTATGEGDTVAWVEHPAGISGVTELYLREGAVVFTAVMNLQPGQSQQVTWSGMTIDGDIDEVKLRDAEGNDLAVGQRDETLPDPGP